MDEIAEWNDRMFEEHPTPYHGLAGMVERARIAVIRRMADITPADAVLEIGCEAGNVLLALPEAGRTVGFDISRKALDVAQAAFAEAERAATFVQGNAEEPLPFERGAFSVIICSEMLEHVENPRAVLEQIYDIATPATRIILTVPVERPKLVMKKMLAATGLFNLLLPGIEKGLSEWHLQEFSRKRLLEEIEGLFRPLSTQTLLGLHVIAQVEKIKPLTSR